MKTIMHITECLGSGVLYYIKNLTAWQIKDFKVVIAYSTRPETPKDFQNQFDSSVQFIKVDGFTREIKLLSDMKAFNNIKKIVKNFKPDIIHLHSTKAGVIGRWAIDCNKYTVFYSPHAYSFLMRDCSDFKRRLYRFIEKISDRKRCLTITDSNGEYEESKKVSNNSICILNGVNTDELDGLIQIAQKHLGKKNKKTVCMMGKAVPQKNPELFNEIASLMPDYDFWWIGAGPLENKLVSKNIFITGWLSRVEAFARIMDSDVFIFTSAWESLSIALMEVMYIGMPCVASNCDGNKDVISNGNNGFLCDKAYEYKKKIEQIIEDESLRNKLKENAHSIIMNKYSNEKMKEKYSELLKEYM